MTCAISSLPARTAFGQFPAGYASRRRRQGFEVVMNVLLAFAIFTGIVWLASPQVGAKFAEVQPDSPASAAGLQPGETIAAIDGQRFQVFVGPEIVDVLRANAGEAVTL